MICLCKFAHGCEQVNRIGVRVVDMQFPQVFRDKVERMASYWKRAYPIEVDVAKTCEEYLAYWHTIQPTVVDSVVFLNEAMAKGRRVMVEGANATMLDLDFGTYPYVTSSNCSIGGACTGLGIPPSKIGAVVGVVKVLIDFFFFFFWFSPFLFSHRPSKGVRHACWRGSVHDRVAGRDGRDDAQGRRRVWSDDWPPASLRLA